MPLAPTTHSDSEDDDDYAPPAEKGLDSSDEEEPEAKRPRATSPQESILTEAEKQKTRNDLWSSFQASLTDKPKESEKPKPMVKIEKRYKFAGDDVVEVVEVPEDSEDAKKWPRWEPEPAASSSAQSTPPTSLPNPPPKPQTSRPGPRKSKIALAPLPSSSAQKARKLTTLDKSAMDWNSHLKSTDTVVKDELEANRKGGGYIEKMEFLGRVEERKAGAAGAGAGTKRRRG